VREKLKIYKSGSSIAGAISFISLGLELSAPGDLEVFKFVTKRLSSGAVTGSQNIQWARGLFKYLSQSLADQDGY
jgi:hypothetical protein